MLFELTVPAGTGRAVYRFRVHEGNGSGATGGTRETTIRTVRPGAVGFRSHCSTREPTTGLEKLGPHHRTIDGWPACTSRWAQWRRDVSVIGDGNGWDGRAHPMRRLVPSGIWEIFIPAWPAEARYKYEIRTPAGHLLKKADPYARQFEVPPDTASIVGTDPAHEWGDGDWMRDRAGITAGTTADVGLRSHLARAPTAGRGQPQRPTARPRDAGPVVREMGHPPRADPVMEHPFTRRGAIRSSLLCANQPFGTPDDSASCSIIATATGSRHPRLGARAFSTDAHGLAQATAQSLYEHADPARASTRMGHADLQLRRNEVRTFLL